MNRLIVNENPYFGRGFLVLEKKTEKNVTILKRITYICIKQLKQTL